MILFSFPDKNYFSRLIFLILTTLIGILLSSFIGIICLISGQDYFSVVTNTAILQTLSQVCTFLLPILLLQYYDKKNCYLPLNPKKIKYTYFIFWFSIFIISMPLMSFLTDWNKNIHLPDTFAKLENLSRQLENQAETSINLFLSNTSSLSLIGNLLLIALLPAFAEEFFFRGGLQTIFTKWFHSPHLAIWLSSIIFSFIHLQFFGFFPRLALGLLLGYTFYYSKSLSIPILLHFINNASIVIWYFLFNRHLIQSSPEISNQSPSPWLILTSLTLLIALFSWSHHSKFLLKKE